MSESFFKATYIIAYTHSNRNYKVLMDNLSQIHKNQNIQTIVVECGEIPVIENMDLKSKYIFLESDIYNLGWIFNIGASNASTSLMFFAENEAHPKIEIINAIIDNHGDRDCIYPQEHYYTLTPEETDSRAVDVDLNEHKKPSDLRGITFLTRKGYDTVGGYDENVFNDDLWQLQDFKYKNRLNMGKVDDSILVNFHTDNDLISNTPKEVIEYSSKHTTRILSLDNKTLFSYIKAQSKKIANPYKYIKNKLMNP